MIETTTYNVKTYSPDFMEDEIKLTQEFQARNNLNELYLTFISQSDQSIKKQQLTNYFLIGSEQVELDKISKTNYVSCDLTLFTKPLCKQGTIIPRGPPIA